MDLVTKAKWDKAAANFDLMAGYGPEKRWEPYKRALFSKMGDGPILFLAVGTGLDIRFFPPGRKIVGIDISNAMLEKAAPRVDAYEGEIELRAMDVHDMPFEDGHFDQVFTSCTFCSVPRPIEGLKALHRVLKPGGELHMFEHTGSRYFPFSVMMNVMTPLSRRFGPEMNRKTVENVLAAGFRLTEVKHVYLDVVKTISAIA
ncbi:MAG: class I SAM-dependent methyltransferase [Deltaproteobacteria bacterium]|jgi:ubiquinone/menaquinone biosynthesis C-methylase UbiE|nr:class I SAM-dependent methyltransferase [Deltaproteobacteria bacterium]MBW2498616.1 class I SAM-dependent methyltransferase [Deltaproteobacteria bacterium]